MHATKFVESYIDAWNHRDPKAVADHLADDGIYYNVPENLRITHDELIVTLSDFFTKYRHRYELIGDILTGRDTIAFQYRMCPRGRVSAGESTDLIRGAEFMTLNGDAAVTIADYYEVAGARRPAHLNRLTARTAHKPKYAKSGLTDIQMFEYRNRLTDVMQTKQAFLRSDLTLPKLAAMVDCSVNHLSQVINAGFGISFFDYVNRYRVEHAKELLSRLGDQRGAVLNIAFTVGFNSNSAFYAAFKKFVGQTPAQFRRARLRDHH